MLKRVFKYIKKQYLINTMSPSEYARYLGVKVGDDCNIHITSFGL